MQLRSYPDIFAISHKAVKDVLLDGPVCIQRKMDGSQISFGMQYDFGIEQKYGDVVVSVPHLCIRSKGAIIQPDMPPTLFKPAVDHIKSIAHLLPVGWTFRGEAICKPKHNVLQYGRCPNGNIVLYDVDMGQEDFEKPAQVRLWASELGVEPVETLFEGTLDSLDDLKKYLDLPDPLGNVLTEGIVIKCYGRYGPDKKTLMAKIVREEFKEVHKKTWKTPGQQKQEFMQELISEYATPPRFRKAIQHLRDRGDLTESPKDIGLLMREVHDDVEKECIDEIKDALYKHFKKEFYAGVIRPVPQFYKQYLEESLND
jgi:hypothetical protein